MGCRIMHDREQNIAALYCSTTDVAFGPIIEGDNANGQDADERAEAFLRYLKGCDPRSLDEQLLMGCFSNWLTQEAEQYKRENPETCYDCGEPVGTCDDDCPSKAVVHPPVCK